MNNKQFRKSILTILLVLILSTLYKCSNEQTKSINQRFPLMSENSSSQNDGLDLHLKNIDSRPSNILLTAYPNIRITPVFQVLKNSFDEGTHTGSPNFHYSYSEDGTIGNNWNSNLIPGFKAVYGYKMVNVSFMI